MAAARDPETRRGAAGAIIEIYWKPAYKYIRLKWNKPNEDARDLTQSFFASLLERDLLVRWEPARASFRTYLRLCIDGHVKNETTAAGRAKRGGDVRVVSLDFESAERELEVADAAASPEDLFHREWQRRMFELAIGDLKAHCEATGKHTQFRVFEQYDLGSGEGPRYEDLADEHGIAATAVTNYLAWARRELRRMLLERLERTTAGGSELRSEARDLLRGPRR